MGAHTSPLPPFLLAQITAERVRHAIQDLLDEMGDGWQLAQHVIVMSLERITDGRIETIAWYWPAPGTADWMVTGLLDSALDLNAAANAERRDDP